MYACVEMRSSEITNLKLVVDAKKIKTFCTMKKVCKQWASTISPISTKRTITFHLKSLNLSKNCLLQLFPHFKYIKYLSGHIVCWKGNLALQVGKQFFNKYNYNLPFVYAFSV